MTEVDTVRRGKRKIEETRHTSAKRRRTVHGPARSREGSIESDAEDEDDVHNFYRVQIVHKEARTSATSSPATRRGSPSNTLQVVDRPFSTSGERFKAFYSKHSASSEMQIDASSSPLSSQPPESSPQVQEGLAPSSNMSMDTDCDHPTPSPAWEPNRMWSSEPVAGWQGFSRHPIGARGAEHLGGADSIFTRMGTPSTASQEIPKLRRQDTFSKSFYGWVDDGSEKSILDLASSTTTGDDKGHSGPSSYP